MSLPTLERTTLDMPAETPQGHEGNQDRKSTLASAIVAVGALAAFAFTTSAVGESYTAPSRGPASVTSEVNDGPVIPFPSSPPPAPKPQPNPATERPAAERPSDM